jgi:hypothetical protein
MSFGNNSANAQLELSRQEAASARLRQLADLSRRQAEVDQEKATGGSGGVGRRLLTFIGAGDGSQTVG